MYGPDGWYLGEMKGKDRLITNISKKGCFVGVSLQQYAPWALMLVMRTTSMYAGFEDFPAPEVL
jgi:hypothetical protein